MRSLLLVWKVLYLWVVVPHQPERELAVEAARREQPLMGGVPRQREHIFAVTLQRDRFFHRTDIEQTDRVIP